MSSANIALCESTDHNYAVNTSTGEAFVSQREAAKLCGVSQVAIFKYLRDNQNAQKSPETQAQQGLEGDNQITDSILAEMVIYYATQGKPQAAKTAMAFVKAGARAFIYSQAGYDPRPAPAPVPKPREPLKLSIKWVPLEHPSPEQRQDVVVVEKPIRVFAVDDGPWGMTPKARRWHRKSFPHLY